MTDLMPSPRPWRIAVVALAALVHAPYALAECPFPHPARGGKMMASLVQAFVACDFPNGGTESNTPSCAPAETYAELNGSDPDSWQWGPNSSGVVRMWPYNGDLALSAALKDVRNSGGVADGTGAVLVLIRMTLDDANGVMTAVDFPVPVAIEVAHGRGKVKTTLNTIVTQPPYNLGAIGPCSVLELVTPPLVQDPTGALFARAGLFLP
jgi:hypothetical protein